MTKTKNKIRVKISAGSIIKSRAEMETLVGEIAALRIQAVQEMASLDTEINRARAAYESVLSNLSEKIELKVSLAKAWADMNPSEFAGKKSIEFLHGTVAFRTGMPSLKPLSGWTLELVLEAIKTKPNWREEYVRTKDEVNKEKILAAYPHVLDAADLRRMGLRFTQSESFKVETPLIEVTEPRVLTTAQPDSGNPVAA